MSSDKSVTAKASLGSLGGEDAAVSFPGWDEVLRSRERMNPDAKMRWKFAILGLLKFCKMERRPVSITLIKGYLEVMRAQGKLMAETREAFLWFVAEARRTAQLKRKDEVEGMGREATEARPAVGAGRFSGGHGGPPSSLE